MEQIGQREEQMVLDDMRMPGDDVVLELQEQLMADGIRLEIAQAALHPSTRRRVLREVAPEEGATWGESDGEPIPGYQESVSV